MEKLFSVLYTHQKTKKAKTWQDGTLKVCTAQNRAILYDSKKSKLDALYIRQDQVCPGEELESDRYLIQVEEPASEGPASRPADPPRHAPPSHPPRPAPSRSGGVPLRQPRYPDPASRQQQPPGPTSALPSSRGGGVKRRGGFIPPRQLKAQRTDPTPQVDDPPTMTALQVLQANKSRLTSAQSETFVQGGSPRPSLFNMYSGKNEARRENTPPRRQPMPAVDRNLTDGNSELGFRMNSWDHTCDADSPSSSQPWVVVVEAAAPAQNDTTVDPCEEEETRWSGEHKPSVSLAQRQMKHDPHSRSSANDYMERQDIEWQGNNQDSDANRNKPAQYQTLSRAQPDSKIGDADELLLSQGARGSLPVYDRVLSSMRAADGPSPWSIVGKKKKISVNQNKSPTPAIQTHNTTVQSRAKPDVDNERAQQWSSDLTNNRTVPLTSTSNSLSSVSANLAPVRASEILSSGAKRKPWQILALIGNGAGVESVPTVQVSPISTIIADSSVTGNYGKKNLSEESIIGEEHTLSGNNHELNDENSDNDEEACPEQQELVIDGGSQKSDTNKDEANVSLSCSLPDSYSDNIPPAPSTEDGPPATDSPHANLSSGSFTRNPGGTDDSNDRSLSNEAQPCFELSFSPLSHVSYSDQEDDSQCPPSREIYPSQRSLHDQPQEEFNGSMNTAEGVTSITNTPMESLQGDNQKAILPLVEVELNLTPTKIDELSHIQHQSATEKGTATRSDLVQNQLHLEQVKEGSNLSKENIYDAPLEKATSSNISLTAPVNHTTTTSPSHNTNPSPTTTSNTTTTATTANVPPVSTADLESITSGSVGDPACQPMDTIINTDGMKESGSVRGEEEQRGGGRAGGEVVVSRKDERGENGEQMMRVEEGTDDERVYKDRDNSDMEVRQSGVQEEWLLEEMDGMDWEELEWEGELEQQKQQVGTSKEGGEKLRKKINLEVGENEGGESFRQNVDAKREMSQDANTEDAAGKADGGGYDSKGAMYGMKEVKIQGFKALETEEKDIREVESSGSHSLEEIDVKEITGANVSREETMEEKMRINEFRGEDMREKEVTGQEHGSEEYAREPEVSVGGFGSGKFNGEDLRGRGGGAERGMDMTGEERKDPDGAVVKAGIGDGLRRPVVADREHGSSPRPARNRLRRGDSGTNPARQEANPTAQPPIQPDCDSGTAPTHRMSPHAAQLQPLKQALINRAPVNGQKGVRTVAASSAFVRTSTMTASDNGHGDGHPTAHGERPTDTDTANKTQMASRRGPLPRSEPFDMGSKPWGQDPIGNFINIDAPCVSQTVNISGDKPAMKESESMQTSIIAPGNSDDEPCQNESRNRLSLNKSSVVVDNSCRKNTERIVIGEKTVHHTKNSTPLRDTVLGHTGGFENEVKQNGSINNGSPVLSNQPRLHLNDLEFSPEIPFTYTSGQCPSVQTEQRLGVSGPSRWTQEEAENLIDKLPQTPDPPPPHPQHGEDAGHGIVGYNTGAGCKDSSQPDLRISQTVVHVSEPDVDIISVLGGASQATTEPSPTVQLDSGVTEADTWHDPSPVDRYVDVSRTPADIISPSSGHSDSSADFMTKPELSQHKWPAPSSPDVIPENIRRHYYGREFAPEDHGESILPTSPVHPHDEYGDMRQRFEMPHLTRDSAFIQPQYAAATPDSSRNNLPLLTPFGGFDPAGVTFKESMTLDIYKRQSSSSTAQRMPHMTSQLVSGAVTYPTSWLSRDITNTNNEVRTTNLPGIPRLPTCGRPRLPLPGRVGVPPGAASQLSVSQRPVTTCMQGVRRDKPPLPDTVKARLETYTVKGAVVSDRVRRQDTPCDTSPREPLPTLLHQTPIQHAYRGLGVDDLSLYDFEDPNLLKPAVEETPFVFSPVQLPANNGVSPSQEVPAESLPSPGPWFLNRPSLPLDDSPPDHPGLPLTPDVQSLMVAKPRNEVPDRSWAINDGSVRQVGHRSNVVGCSLRDSRATGRDVRPQKRRPLRCQPTDDPVVHTSYSTCVGADESGLGSVDPLEPRLGHCERPRAFDVSEPSTSSTRLGSVSGSPRVSGQMFRSSPAQVVPADPSPKRPPAESPRPLWLVPDSPGGLSFLDSPLPPSSHSRSSRLTLQQPTTQTNDNNNYSAAAPQSLRSAAYQPALNQQGSGNNTRMTALRRATAGFVERPRPPESPFEESVLYDGQPQPLADEWRSTQESHSEVVSDPGGTPEQDDLMPYAADGASKWDAFRAEDKTKTSMTHYHSRFSQPALPLQEATNANRGEAVSRVSDLDDEWQQEFLGETDFPVPNRTGPETQCVYSYQESAMNRKGPETQSVPHYQEPLMNRKGPETQSTFNYYQDPAQCKQSDACSRVVSYPEEDEWQQDFLGDSSFSDADFIEPNPHSASVLPGSVTTIISTTSNRNLQGPMPPLTSETSNRNLQGRVTPNLSLQPANSNYSPELFSQYDDEDTIIDAPSLPHPHPQSCPHTQHRSSSPYNSPGGATSSSSSSVVPVGNTRGRHCGFRAPRPVGGSTVGQGVGGSTVGQGVGGSTVGQGVGGSTVGQGVGGSTVDQGVGGSTVGQGVGGSTVGQGVGGSTVVVGGTVQSRSPCTTRPPVFSTPTLPHSSTKPGGLQGELRFPGCEDVETTVTPQRQAVIPASFSSAALYRQALTNAIREHLNVLLFELARRYHAAMARVDTTDYDPGHGGGERVTGAATSTNPVCKHGAPTKMVQVRKPGTNQGRFFFTCGGERNQQCGFFKWADSSSSKAATPGSGAGGGTGQASALKISDGHSLTSFLRGSGINFYCECQLLRKDANSYRQNMPNWMRKKMGLDDESTQKKKLFLQLPRKEASSSYGKGDLWVLSSQLDFDPAHTIIVCTTFYGPNQAMHLEIQPIGRYSPSNWPNGAFCHAIHVGNASSELGCMANVEETLLPSTLPILPHLLNRSESGSADGPSRGFSAPKMHEKNVFFVPGEIVDEIAAEMVDKYGLNEDQSVALLKIAAMFASARTQPQPPITLIHGVFGAGKSYLLAVVVLFLSRLFTENDVFTPDVPDPLKVLISSTTNVAVDRILLGLLDLGHDDFVRVGSVKKIAKPILPYSVHATGSDNKELKDLQEMMKSQELTSTEKIHVRRSIEQYRKGANKKRLKSVRIVGVTCAACAFQCLQDFKFPVVLLDECSQMTEPMSLLPIAKFGCHKLVLVGDPKQLDPTIQGSDPGHQQGLEQTLFDRLLLMGHDAVMLRTQYRCHPLISAIPNKLFYARQLRDGITPADRPPLLAGWPSLSFLDVRDGCEKGMTSGSFYNDQEAELIVALIDRLTQAGVEPASIGVITLYKGQQARTAQLLTDSHSQMKGVQVSTVDAFQGGERDVIFLSCVRTHYVGFIDSDKRTNVALSRAKHHLFIVGHRKNLTNNPLWRKVIKHCLESPRGMQIGTDFLNSLETSSTGGEPQSQRRQGALPPPPDVSVSGDSTVTTGSVQGGTAEHPSPPMDMSPDNDFTVVSGTRRSRQKKVHHIDLSAFDDPPGGDLSDSDDDLPTYL